MVAGQVLALAGAFSIGLVSGTAAALLRLRKGNKQSKARLVPQPHPDWQPGQPQPPPYQNMEMITLDPAVEDKPSMYAFLISAVVPRPVALVSTQDIKGVGNLSTFSYFNVMGHNPPTVALGFTATPTRTEGKKDTLQNIEDTREFVINIISDWYVEAANHTCGAFPRGVNEMQLAGLTPLPSHRVRPPRVKESAVQMECRLAHIYPMINSLGQVGGHIVIGEIVLIHVAEAVAGTSHSGKLVVDPLKLAPISRLGGITYGRMTELYDITRPQV